MIVHVSAHEHPLDLPILQHRHLVDGLAISPQSETARIPRMDQLGLAEDNSIALGWSGTMQKTSCLI